MSRLLVRVVVLALGLSVFFAPRAPVRPTDAAENVPRDLAPVIQQVDKLLRHLAQREKVSVSPPADDLEYLRRLSLDLIARLPTPAEIHAYESSTDPAKKARRVDEMLASEEFASYWGNRWAREFVEGHFQTSNWMSRPRWIEYMTDVFRTNKPYAQVVKELVDSEGDAREIGPTNFILSCDGDAAEVAGMLARQVLGISMQCAQCHDHPYEKWTQKDFWGVAAYFARAKASSYMVKDATYYILKEENQGDLEIPRREGLRVQPSFPVLGIPDKLSDKGNRRQTLAAILLLPQNLRMSEVAVNRVWKQFFGQGFVEPFDAFGEKTQTRFAPVLRRLAEDFARSGTDLKRLIRIIALSETYGRTSLTDTPGSAETRAFERASIRRLDSFQQFHALLQATDYRAAVLAWHKGNEAKAREGIEWLRQRFVALPDERTRTMMYFNGDMTRHAVEDGPMLRGLIEEGLPEKTAMDRMFLLTLSRHATAEEKNRLQHRLDLEEDLLQGYRALYWGLLNSMEFQTNH